MTRVSEKEGGARWGSEQFSKTNKRTKLQKIIIIIIINQKYFVPPHLSFLFLPVFFITKKKRKSQE